MLQNASRGFVKPRSTIPRPKQTTFGDILVKAIGGRFGKNLGVNLRHLDTFQLDECGFAAAQDIVARIESEAWETPIPYRDPEF